MPARRFLLLTLFLALAGVAGLAFWVAGWMEKRVLPASGGLFVPGEMLIEGPHFLQGDPRWGADPLGSTPDSLSSVGCAVTSAAMVLAGYGVDTDPGRLNARLTALEGGYTPEGWLYWEKAVDPRLAAEMLPHYEDQASYFLMDWNLLRGNPVIVRLRYPSGTTHFIVICGKQGFDYLVRDPAKPGICPLKNFGAPIEALRFYRKPVMKDGSSGNRNAGILPAGGCSFWLESAGTPGYGFRHV